MHPRTEFSVGGIAGKSRIIYIGIRYSIYLKSQLIFLIHEYHARPDITGIFLQLGSLDVTGFSNNLPGCEPYRAFPLGNLGTGFYLGRKTSGINFNNIVLVKE